MQNDLSKRLALPASLRERVRQSRGAFSLTELLVTISIMVLLGTVAFPALQSLRSTRLTTCGNQLADLVNQARQNAVTHNTPTAVVLVNNGSDVTLNNRLLCLVEYRSATQAWAMVTPWTLLPPEVALDTTNSDVFLKNCPTLTPSIGTLKYQGRSFATGQYAYQVFLSDGTMESSQIPANATPVLRLVQNNTAVAANYYDIVLNVYTGIPKIERP